MLLPFLSLACSFPFLFVGSVHFIVASLKCFAFILGARWNDCSMAIILAGWMYIFRRINTHRSRLILCAIKHTWMWSTNESERNRYMSRNNSQNELKQNTCNAPFDLLSQPVASALFAPFVCALIRLVCIDHARNTYPHSAPSTGQTIQRRECGKEMRH